MKITDFDENSMNKREPGHAEVLGLLNRDRVLEKTGRAAATDKVRAWLPRPPGHTSGRVWARLDIPHRPVAVC